MLKAIAEVVDTAIKHSKHQPQKKIINFVRPGEKIPNRPKTGQGRLSTAPDWQLMVDLGSRLKFPENIVATNLRPDLLLISNKTKQIIMWELTVCWEENFESANEYKRSKYQQLLEDCQKKKWRANCIPIEIGCRGFMSKSMCHALTSIGITGITKRKAIKAITHETEMASKWLWIKRSDPNWCKKT